MNSQHRRRRVAARTSYRFLMLAGACLTSGWMSPCLADTSSNAEAAPGVLEEIVVTAQKRAENVQEVPIAISVIGTDVLGDAGTSGTVELKNLVPALNITTGVGGFGLPRIRGIGASGQGPGIENPVAVVVDGVYHGAAFGVLQSLFDTAQVAVLKGPQGTLFGRNATGGVIQVTTYEPGFDQHGKAILEYGNYDTKRGAAFVTGGITDTLAISLSGQYEKRDKGFGTNVVTGNDVQDGDTWAGRLKLKWLATEDTTVLLSGDFMGRDASEPAFRNFGLNTLGQNIPQLIINAGGDPANDIYSDMDPLLTARQKGGSATINHDFGGVELKSITAYRDTKLRTLFDPDGTALARLRIDNHNFDEQFTQELDLLSTDDGPLTWVLGGFYMWNSAGQEPGRTTGLLTFGGNGYSDVMTDVRLNSISGFAQTSYAISDDTKITGGLRYTHDERTFEAYSVEYNGNTRTTTRGALQSDSRTFSKVTWRLALDHQFTPDVMGYVSYNRGFRSGTFVPQANPIIVLEPEVVDAYEVGLKTDLFDGIARLNVAAYFYDQTNVQVQQVISGTNSIYNADGAETYGVDADLTVQVTDNFRVFGGLGYTHARYTDFTNAIISVPYPLASSFVIPTGQTCRGTFGNPRTQLGGNCLIIGDASGNKLQNTPAITANFGGSLEIPTEIGSFTFSGNYYYNDGYVGTADERVVQDSYDLVSGSVTWHNPTKSYFVKLWAQNLTNSHYFAQIGATNSGDNGTPGAPRTFGLTIGADF